MFLKMYYVKNVKIQFFSHLHQFQIEIKNYNSDAQRGLHVTVYKNKYCIDVQDNQSHYLNCIYLTRNQVGLHKIM